MSMAHSIESRVPLLDHEVVEFAAALPSEMKIRGTERKRVLKRVAAGILPAEVLTRRKQGFGVPIGDWFRGPLRGLMSDALQSPRARQRGYFAPQFVDRLIAEHLSQRRDHASRLWTLLMLELWHREYLDRPISAGVSGNAAVPFDPTAFPQKDKAAGGRARQTPLGTR
jgi:asparagine synthase (glutamine-hydrolysing)